jgi:hypothetical protein
VVEVEIPNKKKRSQGEGCAAALLRLAYKKFVALIGCLLICGIIGLATGDMKMAFGALLAVGLSAFFIFARWIPAPDERRLEEAREKEAKEETDD